MSVTYNVIWGTPGRSSTDSMPLGNGETGINIWTEENGDCCLYLARTDAWDEAGRLAKLGRVRIHMEPPLPQDLFRQELDLETGSVNISAGRGENAVCLRVWVDAHRQIIWADMDSTSPRSLTVSLEIWRTTPQTFAPGSLELGSFIGQDGEKDPVCIAADTVLDGGNTCVMWHHRNPSSIWMRTLTQQGLDEYVNPQDDPLLNRTFGGGFIGTGLIRTTPQTLTSEKPQCQCQLAIATHTSVCAEKENWEEEVQALLKNGHAAEHDEAWLQHAAWWRARWSDHHITLSGDATAQRVGQGYALHRFMLLACGRGAFPIKFNGALFTMDTSEKGSPVDADYRRWGGPYWFQNTRLAYWPMLMAGDHDCLKPFFEMYHHQLPLAKARTKKYYDHNGAYLSETATFWGSYRLGDYGYERDNLPIGITKNTYIRRHWDGALELLTMHLEAEAFQSDETFWKERILPLAREVLAFFEEHYPLKDGYGHAHFSPSQSLETWQKATNPTPIVAGLRWCLHLLLDEPQKNAIPDADRTRWEAFLAILPPIPTRSIPHSSRRTVLPASEYDELLNCENPELYAIFPYRMYSLFRDDIDAAQAAFDARLFKKIPGWGQDGIQAALLGRTDEAAELVTSNFSKSEPNCRFPAFWGPNFDWIPDMDHGGTACIALQRMLLQYDGDQLLLLPAWPKNWAADFRLHAPKNTIIEGRVEGGNITRLSVTPPEREKDIRTHTTE